MRDLYLLAAGLLTGLVIPTSALPHLPNVNLGNSGTIWNLKDDLKPNVGGKILSSGENFQAEFSDSCNPKQVESQLSSKTQIDSRPITSGNKLYY